MNNVWVIGNYSNTSTNYNDHILATGFANRGWNVKGLQFELIDINEQDQLTYSGEVLVAPDLAVFSQPIFTLRNSFYFEKKNKLFDLLKQFNTLFINDIYSHCNAIDKTTMYRLLIDAAAYKKLNCPIPLTAFLGANLSDEEKMQIVEYVGGFPIVFKEVLSSRAEGVYLVNDLEEMKATEIEIRKKIGSTTLIVQQFMSMGGIMLETRVIGEDVRTRITLGSPSEDFKSNINIQRSYVACKTTPELREISLNAMKALSLDIARLDVFYSGGEYKICEVNSLGSILGSEMSWNQMVGQDIADYCISKYHALKS